MSDPIRFPAERVPRHYRADDESAYWAPGTHDAEIIQLPTAALPLSQRFRALMGANADAGGR
jgi:hypothetical protein